MTNVFITYACKIISLFKPCQAKNRVAGEMLTISEFVVHVAHTTLWGGRPRLLPWSGRCGLPGSGICVFLEVRYTVSPQRWGCKYVSTAIRLRIYHHCNGVANTVTQLRLQTYYRSEGATKSSPQQWDRKQYLGCKTTLLWVLGLHWVFQQQCGCIHEITSTSYKMNIS